MKQLNANALSLSEQLRSKFELLDSANEKILLLQLLRNGSENPNDYVGILAEFLAAFKNDPAVQKRFPNPEATFKDLQSMLNFFVELNSNLIRAYIDILELETNSSLSTRSVTKIRGKHFVTHIDDDLPF